MRRPTPHVRGRTGRAVQRDRELRAFDVHHRDVVLAARLVRTTDQLAADAVGLAGVLRHGLDDLGRRHLVGEPVRAQQQRAVPVERDATRLDEIGVARAALLRADVPKDLVAPRVAHRFGLGNLTRILPHADGRMVARDLRNGAAPDLVQPRIADVPDHRLAIRHHRHRQHACHPGELRTALRLFEDAPSGQRDAFADAFLDGAGRALQARQQLRFGDRRGPFAAGLPADAVDDEIDAALVVFVDTVFIVAADTPGITDGGGAVH